jgi:4-amino-4-deoxy-L-arabinose transferase-like glycosyltransferase
MVRFARAAMRSIAQALAENPAVVVFAAAMLPRLVFLAQLRAHSPTFYFPEGGDSILYDRIASGVPEPFRAYFHSPLYIWFLSGLYKILGRNLLAVRLVQHLCGATACVFVHHVTLRAFHSRSTALGAGLLAAVAGPVLFYEGQIGVDAILPLLVMTCAMLTLRASSRGRTLDWSIAGLAVGVTALARPVVLTWLLLLTPWAFASRGSRRNRLRSVAGLLVGTALVIAPVTVRNYFAEKDFVLITANGGLNFYVGNNPHANGAYVYPRGLAFRPGDPSDDFEGKRFAEESEGHAMTSSAVSSWWSKKGWRFVRENPERTATLAIEKAKLLVSNVEYMQLQDYDVYREVAPVLDALPMSAFQVVPGLAGLMAVALSRQRRPLARRLALLAVVFAAGFLPFFVVGRYRAPWLLLLAPFAAFAIGSLAKALRTRAWREAGVLAGVAALNLWVTTRPLESVPGVGFQYMSFARASLWRGDRAGAEHWCERATSRDWRAVDAAALLARLRREDRRYGEAERTLTRALAADPQSPALWLEVGRVRLETGHAESAIDALRSSIDGDPRSVEAWSTLADALRAAGRDADALTVTRSVAVLRGADPRGPG